MNQNESYFKLVNSIDRSFIFDYIQCNVIEGHVERLKLEKNFTPWTIDNKPLRKKFFFGERYTYGSEVSKSGSIKEYLYPKHLISPIPSWIESCVIQPLVNLKIVPPSFVNSVTINDYQPNGCIVSHIDPPHIFDRPIISVNLFSDSALSFGCKFQFKPIRCTEPVLSLPLARGSVTSIWGFAANEITHCIRPQDVKHHRAAMILRRVLPTAPRLSEEDIFKIDSNKLQNMYRR